MHETTARQIASALGLSPQAARRLIGSGVASRASETGVRLYRLADLPPALRARLADRARATGHANIFALLENCNAAWQPGILLEKICPKQIAEATCKRDALAPILTRSALVDCPTSDLVRLAFEAMVANSSVKFFSGRTLRRSIELAIYRDRGRFEWDRIELYMPPKVRRADTEPSPAHSSGEEVPGERLQMIAQALADIKNPRQITRVERAELWALILKRIDDLAGQGFAEKKVVSAVVAMFDGSDVRLSTSAESLRKTIKSGLQRYRNEGGKLFKRDRREGNKGKLPEVAATEEEKTILRRMYVKSNRGRGLGSKILALQMFARRPECSKKLAEFILRKRASKHSVPDSLLRIFDGLEDTIAYYRNPRKFRLGISTSPGTMRTTQEPYPDGTATLSGTRRLFGGERESWDDASINFICVVPWEIGGCKCSDRFGVKVGRFQLLAGVDDGTGYCPGFSFVVREQASYRATDVVGAMARVWLENIVPAACMLERGTWESNAVRDLYTAAGVEVKHTYTPHQKLVEKFWNNLWTNLSVLTEGQIGRFRGEMQRENAQLTRCQAGQLDPRGVFPSLQQTLDFIEEAIRINNATGIDSGLYGKWIPEERYREDLERFPRESLDPDCLWLMAPARKDWTIRTNGTVGGSMQSPYGGSVDFHFAFEEIWKFAGAKVRVYFDPYLPERGATVRLLEDFGRSRSGEILTRNAEILDQRPLAERIPGDDDRSEDAAGVKYRKSYLDAVMTSCRVLGLTGRRKSSVTEFRDGRGNLSAAENLASGASAYRGEGWPPSKEAGNSLLSKARKVRPLANRAPELSGEEEAREMAELERLERQAIERGDIFIQ